MKVEHQERLHAAFAKLKLAHENVTMERERNYFHFSMPCNDANTRYCGRTTYNTTIYGSIDYVESRFYDLVYKPIRQWHLRDKNVKTISTIDAFFGLTKHGQIERPFEVDRLLINVLARADISIQQFIDDIGYDLVSKYRSKPSSIGYVGNESFANIHRNNIDRYFHKWQKGFTQLCEPYCQTLPFNGCIDGKQLMAFDVRLAPDIHYYSSVSPTITMRNQVLPKTMFGGLRKRPVNDLLNEKIFSEDVVITRVTVSNNIISLGISPDRQDITHLGKQTQIQKLAA